MVNFNFFSKSSQKKNEPKLPQIVEEEVPLKGLDDWDALSRASTASSVEKSDLVRTKSGREGFVLGHAHDCDGDFFEIQYENGREGIRKMSSIRILACTFEENFKPGKYEIIARKGTQSTTQCSIKSPFATFYGEGDVVTITKVVDVVHEERIRGQLEGTGEWISLCATDDGFEWVRLLSDDDEEEESEEFCWNANKQLTVRQTKALAQIKKKLKGAEVFTSEEFDCQEYGWVQTLRGKLNEYNQFLECPQPGQEDEFDISTIRCLAEVRKLLAEMDKPEDEYFETLSDAGSEVETHSDDCQEYVPEEALYSLAYE